MNKTKPVVIRKPWLSGIWLLPLLSALIGGWVLYQSMIEKGIEISILFDNAAGIREGKTPIIYKGVRIGVVREVHISKNLQQVNVIAEIQRAAKEGLRKTTGFWLVKPKVSLTEITGLETIVSGNYIRMNPGEGRSQRDFIALEKPPVIDDYTQGLYIDIFAEHLGSVSRGSKIYFREIPVGEVLDYELAETQSGVIIKVRIEQRYAHLVKHSSRFWNASGLSIKAGLSGLSVHTESLAALIAGGIAFYTPDSKTKTTHDVVGNGTQFELHKDFDSAKVGIAVKINFASAIGLEEGVTDVKYDAFKIGIVKKLSYTKNGTNVIAEVMFDPRATSLLKTGTKFWLDKPKLSLTDFSGLKSLLQGSHINMQVGHGEDSREFVALNKPPLMLAGEKGMHLLLKAESLGSIEYASPILYKKIQVGQVHDFKLDKKGEHVLVDIYISERYAHLVASNSRFWNTSGVHVNLGPSGLDIKTGTVDTILTGGIEFITPDLKHKKVKNGAVYHLYKDYDAATESGLIGYKQDKNTQLIRITTEELGSLAMGTKIYFKKIPVGKIVHYTLSDKRDEIIISAAISNKYQDLITSKSRFWRNSGLQVKADLSGVDVNMASVHSLLNGGISFANIESSVVTKQSDKQVYPLYQSQQQALQQTEDIQIRFPLAQGISKGTAIKYLGIKVGEVSRVELTDNNQAIIAHAKLFDSATEFARQGTRFWLLAAQLGLFKNKHLDTLIKGNYLEIEPGHGQKQTHFVGELNQPEIRNGLHIVLKSPSLGSIKVGNSVSYRQINVGEVRSFQLSKNAQFVLIDIYIAEKYAALIKNNTKFWHASGVQVDFGLFSGAQVRTESLENIVLGGIAFATPDSSAVEKEDNNQVFELYSSVESEWLEWSPKIALAD
ncbi:MAG: MCE family protein [Methyloprofundus sp.]|nr:MCE family protein [Methyloprofundus sp.]